MNEKGSHRRSFMRYRAEDFPLYIFSLVLTGALVFPALPHGWERTLFIATLVYFAGIFIIRHGAKATASAFRAILDGLGSYPRMLVDNWWAARSALLPILGVFLLAVAAEYFLRPLLVGTKWLMSAFPWWWAVWVPFLAITAIRAAVLFTHLHRAALIQEFLERSPIRKSYAGMSIYQHIFHAFATGMVSHLTLVAPCVLFYTLTEPSYLREVLLIGGYGLWTAIAAQLRKRDLIETESNLTFRLFYENHVIAHHSRFFFTVFHGHHHDTIPSAMIGSAGGTGFLENLDRALMWLDPLNSVLVMQWGWAQSIIIDMATHQYIPGVFPYTRTTTEGMAHHVTHHFGSLLPLGMIFRRYIEPKDLIDGYRGNNNVTRWFLDEVERLEGLKPEVRSAFLAVGGPVPSSRDSPAESESQELISTAPLSEETH